MPFCIASRHEAGKGYDCNRTDRHQDRRKEWRHSSLHSKAQPNDII